MGFNFSPPWPFVGSVTSFSMVPKHRGISPGVFCDVKVHRCISTIYDWLSDIASDIILTEIDTTMGSESSSFELCYGTVGHGVALGDFEKSTWALYYDLPRPLFY